MVKLTKIYTRTGDEGLTGLSNFTRVRKTDPRIEAYADVDEANSAIGVGLGAVATNVGQRAIRQTNSIKYISPKRFSCVVINGPTKPASDLS